MAKQSFFADNLHRDYPFIGTPKIPQGTIVDFGCLMGINSGYVEGEHNVWLDDVRRFGEEFDFVFASDAPGLVGQFLVFTFSQHNARYSTEYADCLAAANSLSFSFSESVSFPELKTVDDSLWSGYLVIGDLTELAAMLPVNKDYVHDGTRVEPCLLRNIAMSYLRTINLANNDRTRATAPAGCPALAWGFPTGQIYPNAVGLTGRIRFEAGYNCKVVENTLANSITISAMDPSVEVAAAGQPCDFVPLFVGEAPPAGRTRLDGALGCDEVICSINGADGPQLAIVNGGGLTIAYDTANHVVTVKVNMQGFHVCAAESISYACPPA